MKLNPKLDPQIVNAHKAIDNLVYAKIGYTLNLVFRKVWEMWRATAQPTLFSLRPHTLSTDTHRTMKYGLHIVFDDACPSNATLYHGHKYTLTYFFLT